MAYLEDGHTFDGVVVILKEKHPEIKNIREYTRHAIRSATGDGIYDDYIQEHNLWKLRCPLLTKNEKEPFATRMRELLEEMWKERSEEGRHLIKNDKAAEPLLQEIENPDSEQGRLLKHIIVHGFPKGSLNQSSDNQREAR